MSTNYNKARGNRGKNNKTPRTAPPTIWRSPDPDFAHTNIPGVAPSAGGNKPDPREVFAVVNHEGLQALYCWREDAAAHAKVCAGKVQTMRVSYELPAWVKVMVDRAATLAAQQSSTTIH